MDKLGLVLEGGGMRGLYTAGVLDYFIEKDFYTDGVIGVSAGACHACSYVSKQKGRAYRTSTDYLHDKRYMSIHSLLTTKDLFGVEFVYNDIPNTLDPYDFKAFEASNTKLYAVCSNMETGEAEYYPCTEMHHDVIYIRASASLPLLSRPVEIHGKKLLDGGATDSIPIHYFKKIGYQKNIVVLTQCKDYRKSKNKTLPLIRYQYRKYPSFVEKMENRHTTYNQILDDLHAMEKKGEVYIIRPRTPVTIGRLEKNPDKLKALYNQGYQEAKMHFDAIMTFIQTPYTKE